MASIYWIVPLIAVLATVSMGPASAAIKPASLFTDNAVLQRDMPLPVWGTADPDEPVTVAIDGQKMSTTAGPDGKWAVKLKPVAAGGPYGMTISGAPGDRITLSNILVGDVWVCSGQSNMEFGIRLAEHGNDAIAAADNSQIRLFNAGREMALTPQATGPGNWLVCAPDALKTDGVWGGFSAVGYYFGREVQQAEHVPVGLIQASRGGTMAALWTSREGLGSVPSLKYYDDQLDSEMAYYGESLKPGESMADLKKLYADARAKYDADNAPIIAKFKADSDAADAKYQADADAAKAAGQPVPAKPWRPARPKLPPAPFDFSTVPTTTELFNGIINPLIPYAIRGVIWYQGESNGGGDGSYPARSYEYKTLFPALIADWRSHWVQGDFPFLFVQIAPYDVPAPHQTPDGWAEIREAQRLTALDVPNTGMAVITDLGNSKNVHPTRKEQVGHRLALVARAVVYKEPIEYSGPTLSSAKIDGAAMRVTFTHASGLCAGTVTDADGTTIAAPDKLAGFALAGADQKFYPADAAIYGNTVVVSSPSVPAPVAVRYGFANFPIANLENSAGLFASPFKSDDWPWSSRNNHG